MQTNQILMPNISIQNITPLLTAPKLSEGTDKEIGNFLYSHILKGIKLYGGYGNKTIEDLKALSTEIAKQLIIDIKNIQSLKSLTIAEFDACIVWGVQGELGINRGEFSYRMVYQWVTSYATSPDRKDAINSNITINASKRLEQRTEPTEAERVKIIRESIKASYFNYLTAPESEILSKSSLIYPVYALQGHKEGDIRDLGYVKINYLRSIGLAEKWESLKDFYQRMKNNNIKTLFNGE